MLLIEVTVIHLERLPQSDYLNLCIHSLVARTNSKLTPHGEVHVYSIVTVAFVNQGCESG